MRSGLMKVIKKLLINSVFPRYYGTIDFLALRSFKSSALALHLYQNKQYDRARMRLDFSKDSPLHWNIKYKTKHKGSNKDDIFEGLFGSFGTHVPHLREDLIVEFILWRIEKNYKFSHDELLTLFNKSRHNKRFIIRLFCFFLAPDILEDVLNSGKKVKVNALKEFKVYLKIEDSIGVEKNLSLRCYNPYLDMYSEDDECQFSEKILSFINAEKQFHEILSFIDVISSKKNVNEPLLQKIVYLFNNDSYEYSDKEVDLLLKICWNTSFFDGFVSVFEVNQPESLWARMHYYLIRGMSQEIIEVIDQAILKEDMLLIRKYNYISFFAYCDAQPDKILDYFGRLRSIGFLKPTYQIYKSLFVGDIKAAENIRSTDINGLQYYLSQTHAKSNPKWDDFDVSRILVVSEQGVGDEVRWSRLYSHVDRKNIDIVCDPRLFNVFSNTFQNANFISHPRVFRSTGLTPDDFHKKNIPFTPEAVNKNYDFVISANYLFNIIPQHLISTSANGYLSANKIGKKNRFSIGVAWGSAMRVPLRNLRYAFDVYSIVHLKKALPDVDFYALQGSITKSEKSVCESNGIQVVDDFDINNDFGSLSEFLLSLDAVVGVSTFNNEFAAALGVRFYHLANASEISFMRNGNLSGASFHDQLSNNTTTIYPKCGYVNKTKEEIAVSCIDHVAEILTTQLNISKKQ